MEEKLTSLYNTLLQIETKGDGTIKMAACLHYMESLVSDLKSSENKEAEGHTVLKKVK